MFKIQSFINITPLHQLYLRNNLGRAQSGAEVFPFLERVLKKVLKGVRFNLKIPVYTLIYKDKLRTAIVYSMQVS